MVSEMESKGVWTLLEGTRFTYPTCCTTLSSSLWGVTHNLEEVVNEIIFKNVSNKCIQQMHPTNVTNKCIQQMHPTNASNKCIQQMYPTNVSNKCIQQMYPTNVSNNCIRLMYPYKHACMNECWLPNWLSWQPQSFDVDIPEPLLGLIVLEVTTPRGHDLPARVNFDLYGLAGHHLQPGVFSQPFVGSAHEGAKWAKTC